MLEKARAKIEASLEPSASRRASYVAGSIERLEFPDGHFDFVFSDGDPLSYCIQTHQQAASEMLRVLKPGHGFYASCDNRWHMVLLFLAMGEAEAALRCAREGVSRDPYGNAVHAFEPWELQQVFERAGASGVQVTGKLALAHFFSDPPLAKLLQGSTGQELYRIEAELGRRPAMAGMASHLQVTGRKPVGA
jgi:SAM-dependent methyltransferase